MGEGDHTNRSSPETRLPSAKSLKLNVVGNFHHSSPWPSLGAYLMSSRSQLCFPEKQSVWTSLSTFLMNIAVWFPPSLGWSYSQSALWTTKFQKNVILPETYLYERQLWVDLTAGGQDRCVNVRPVCAGNHSLCPRPVPPESHLPAYKQSCRAQSSPITYTQAHTQRAFQNNTHQKNSVAVTPVTC